MKREELKAILQNAYTQEKWIKTLQFLSGSKNLLTISLEPKAVEIKSAKAKEIVSEIVQLGSLKTIDGINLPIFDVTLLDGIKIEHNRVGVNDLLKNHILRDAIKGAIVTFHYSKKYNKDEWRFSFISKFGSDYFEETESIETNPKKYTYIFGTEEEHRTALERLYSLQQSKFELKDFFDAFNVEPVSKDFFNNYIKFYKDFVNYLSGEELIKGKWVSINEPSKYFDDVFNNNSIEVRNFVKRLLGRIVFLYFIQKKGWLGARSNKYEDGNPNFLQNLFIYDNTTRDNYYNNWLSKLFFDALNNKKRKNDEFLMPDKELLFVPFLNGGLFDEVQEPKNHRNIEFPPILFELLFNFFNGYNFTIYENSPEDHTIAVDPEMLGNIFENLLEDNKDKGAFYTPKEIVHYMAQESLMEYLNTNIPLSKEQLNNLIKNHTTDDLEKEELLTIEKLVDTVKICDPAIGSGAFPMGLLQEIFSLKALLHFALNKNPDDWKPAEVKQAIIENSIYGVDIEPGAVDIARLRFWLSLVVDEPTPKPLPNLDFKIIVGNSLLSRYKLDNPIEEVFKNLNKNRKSNKLEPITLQSYKDCMNDYMYLSDAESKKEYKLLLKEIKDAFVATYSNDKINGLAKVRGKYENLLRVDIFGKPLGTKTEIVKAKKELEFEENKRKEAENSLHYKDAIEWRFEFPNILDADGNYQGFDIIIGNPPYIQIQKMTSSYFDSSILNYSTYSKSGDIYCLFYEKAGMLLKKEGVLSYITSNSWIKTKYGKSLRNYFTSKLDPIKLLNFEDTQIFPSATVEVNILIAKKKQWGGSLSVAIFDNKYLKRQSINTYFENNNFNLVELSDEGWIILNNSEQIIKNLIFKDAIPLKELNVEIRIGIINGFNDAFIINSKLRQEIIKNCHNCNEIIKPLLLGKNLSKFHYEWDDNWLINTHNGIKKLGLSRILVEKDYLEIYKHLLKYKNSLEVRQNKGDHWTNLRNCGYFLEFEQPKILWGELSDKPKFVYDNKGMYADATLFSMTGKNLLELVAILNSKVALWFFNSITTTSGMGTNRWKKYKIEQLPIPKNHENEILRILVEIVQFVRSTKININDMVKNEHIAVLFEEVIDGCVFELYFENLMKEKNIAIIDDVKLLLEKIDFLDNFQSLDEVTKNQKIWEVFKILSNPDNAVRNKILRFPIESPDVLKIILRR